MHMQTVNTDKVRVKVNGEYQGETDEFKVCGVWFTDRKIKVDSELGSTLVSLRKDLVSSDVFTWDYNRLDFKTVNTEGTNEFVTEFRCNEDYYEVLQYHTTEGMSEDSEKQFN